MNWFQRHLNWTVILSFLVYCLIINVIILFRISPEEPLMTSIGDMRYLLGVLAVSTAIPLVVTSLGHFYFLYDFLIPAILFLIVCGWVLHQKNRSLWWLSLPFFIPLGWIAVLCLRSSSRN